MNGAATQIEAREFDGDFFRLPQPIQELVQKKIDAMSLRLPTFPHYRMTGSDKYRLRVGDYRVIYRFDSNRGRDLSAGDWQPPGNLSQLNARAIPGRKSWTTVNGKPGVNLRSEPSDCRATWTGTGPVQNPRAFPAQEFNGPGD
jgi:hypothetical protein